MNAHYRGRRYGPHLHRLSATPVSAASAPTPVDFAGLPKFSNRTLSRLIDINNRRAKPLRRPASPRLPPTEMPAPILPWPIGFIKRIKWLKYDDRAPRVACRLAAPNNDVGMAARGSGGAYATESSRGLFSLSSNVLRAAAALSLAATSWSGAFRPTTASLPSALGISNRYSRTVLASISVGAEP